MREGGLLLKDLYFSLKHLRSGVILRVVVCPLVVGVGPDHDCIPVEFILFRDLKNPSPWNSAKKKTEDVLLK